jgi:hypothetical protein
MVGYMSIGEEEQEMPVEYVSKEVPMGNGSVIAVSVMLLVGRTEYFVRLLIASVSK